MKKLLTITALLGAASLSFGQGIVSFANQIGTRISTNSAAAPSTYTLQAAAPVGTWYYALFRAPSTQNTINTSTDPTLNGWTFVVMGTNTASAGRLSGNNTSEGVVTTPSAPSTDDYAVAGWSVNIGTSWAQAQGWWANGSAAGSGLNPGWFGIAPTIGNDIIAQPTGGSINNIFGSTAGLINGFGLSFFNVPEPSTFSLAGIGAAALLIFRRRK